MVEASFVAAALYETRRWIWDALTPAQQDGVAAWLGQARDKRAYLNNWQLFPVIINAFLKSVGAPHSQSVVERNLDVVDSFYRGNGWYTDGLVANYDYYVAWAIHFFTLMWCVMDGDASDPGRARTYRERAERYLEQFRLFFSADGGALYQGRSLIYRLSLPGLLWMGARTKATSLTPGETRRLASGTLKHFVEREAIDGKRLTAGWYSDFPAMRQFYSGRGSPYWSSQGFLGLLLPPEDPVWTSVEELSVSDTQDVCVAMPEPGFIVSGTSADGIVRVSSHKSDHFPLPTVTPKPTPVRRARGAAASLLGRRHPPPPPPSDPHYRKLAYSTHAAPEQGPKGDEADVDSQITLLRPRGGHWGRRRIHPVAVADRFACSVFYPSEPSVTDRIETASLVRPGVEVRIHHVTSTEARVREGGFAIAGAAEPSIETGDTWASARRADGLTTFIGNLHGYTRASTARLEGANPFGRHSATPVLESGEEFNGEAVFASLVILSGEGVSPQRALEDVTLSVEGRQVLVTFGDGEAFFVSLVGSEPREVSLAGKTFEGRLRYARVSPDGSSYALRD
jgi:hypothetical protein